MQHPVRPHREEVESPSAKGETFSHTPPTEARFWARPGRRLSSAAELPLAESGFGGWVDEDSNQFRTADAEFLIHNIAHTTSFAHTLIVDWTSFR